jgi:hypothetical protein
MERLSLGWPQTLLEQLEAGDFGSQLLMPTHSFAGTAPRLPHHVVVEQFFAADNPVYKELWAKCARKMLELRAPLWEKEQNLRIIAAGNLSFMPELTDAVLRDYVIAGVIDLTLPFPGDLMLSMDSDDWGTAAYDDGMTPLAAAILAKQFEFVGLLLRAGAPLDVGQVIGGGPRWQALDLAQSRGLGEVAAVISDFVMKQHLDRALRGAPSRRTEVADALPAQAVAPLDVADGDDDSDKKTAFFDEDGAAYVSFTVREGLPPKLTDIMSTDEVRGRAMVTWLANAHGRPDVADVLPKVHGFWNKMQAEGLIASWQPMTTQRRKMRV